MLGVLNKHDLAGLGPGRPDGAPIDEYMNEALPIAAILIRGGVLVRADVARVWSLWFDDDLNSMNEADWASLLHDLNDT